LKELKKRQAEGHYFLTDNDAISKIRKMNKQYEEDEDGMSLAGIPFDIDFKHE
jgi:predicted hydrolase (HD superfamily)